MTKRSKYTTLDARIMSAIGARRKRTRDALINDKFVLREMMRLDLHGGFYSGRPHAALSRRLQVLRARCLIRWNWRGQWVTA